MYFELITDRLILRPLDIMDLVMVHAYASDIENTKYMLYLPNGSIEETSQFLARVTREWQKDTPSFYEFAITVEGKLIGAVSIRLDEQRTKGMLGWILNKNFWGKGYATEAAIAVKNFAVNELQISTLIAKCDYRNTASCNIMKKLELSLVSDSGVRRYPKTVETVKELTYSITF